MDTAKIYSLSDYRPIDRSTAARSSTSLVADVARCGFDLQEAFVKLWYPWLVARQPRQRPSDRCNLRGYK
jgi:hypothetical protein